MSVNLRDMLLLVQELCSIGSFCSLSLSLFLFPRVLYKRVRDQPCVVVIPCTGGELNSCIVFCFRDFRDCIARCVLFIALFDV